MKLRLGGIAFALSLSLSALAATDSPPDDILSEFPGLKQYLFREPDTNLRFAMGLAPLMIMNNKAGFSANLFELHWMSPTYDWMIFGASYGTTFSGDPLSKINAFTFRTIPKYRFSTVFSAGLLLGYELVSFPEVKARLYKGTLFSPDEAFSTRGMIYGGALSENFKLGSGFQLKLSQMIYRQNYDPTGTSNGWRYFYADDQLNVDKTLIAPGMVFLLEISVLY